MNIRVKKSQNALPEELPPGEFVLWQGKPDWQSLALRAFHVRKIGIYFVIILAWRLAQQLYEGSQLQSVASNAGPLLLLAVSAVAILALLAWVYARTTTYTITNRRVFMCFGAALPMMLNLPFQIVATAAAKLHSDGTADIPLQLLGSDRVAYLQLWPHARAWRLKHPEPTLRSVPDGARVAKLLASALTTAAPPPASQAIEAAPAESVANTIRASSPFAPAAA